MINRKKNLKNQSELDAFHQAAKAEFAKGYVRLNLMADALTQASGDEQLAHELYLQHVTLKLKQEQKIKALLQQHTTVTANPSARFLARCADFVADYWYVLPTLCVILWVLLAAPKDFFKQTFEQVTFWQDSSDTAIAQMPASLGQSNEQPIVFALQQQYPELDPNHPAYQPALMAQIQTLSQQYQQQGQSLDTAQHAAVLAVLGRPTPNPAQDRQVLSYVPRYGKVQIPTEQPRAAAVSACQHKPVMSNQDYLNCGLKPPSSTAEPVVEDFDPIL